MSYRGRQPGRVAAQTETILKTAGQTATWRQYISAGAGTPDAGFGSVPSYREQTITGLFGQRPNLPVLMQWQNQGGQIAAGMLMLTTRERLGIHDELVWLGEVYRVESDPVPAQMGGYWVCQIKRGEG